MEVGEALESDMGGFAVQLCRPSLRSGRGRASGGW